MSAKHITLNALKVIIGAAAGALIHGFVLVYPIAYFRNFVASLAGPGYITWQASVVIFELIGVSVLYAALAAVFASKRWWFAAGIAYGALNLQMGDATKNAWVRTFPQEILSFHSVFARALFYLAIIVPIAYTIYTRRKESLTT